MCIVYTTDQFIETIIRKISKKIGKTVCQGAVGRTAERKLSILTRLFNNNI